MLWTGVDYVCWLLPLLSVAHQWLHGCRASQCTRMLACVHTQNARINTQAPSPSQARTHSYTKTIRGSSHDSSTYVHPHARTEIDTIGTFSACQAVYQRHMKEHGGTILNITATLGATGISQQAHAGSAKAAIDALTRHLAVEWGPRGIRVNSLAPGPIEDTEGYRKLGMHRFAPPIYARPHTLTSTFLQVLVSALMFLCLPRCLIGTFFSCINDYVAILSSSPILHAALMLSPQEASCPRSLKNGIAGLFPCNVWGNARCLF